MMRSATLLFLILDSSTIAYSRNLIEGLPEAFCGYPIDAITIPSTVTANPWSGNTLAYCNRDATTKEVCEAHEFWDGYHCYWENGVCQSDVPLGGEMPDTTCPRLGEEPRCRSTALVAKRSCVWRVQTEPPSMVPSTAPSSNPTRILSVPPSLRLIVLPTELPTDEANVDFVARQSDGSVSEVEKPGASRDSKMGGSGWTTVAFVGFAAAGGFLCYRRRQRKDEEANKNAGSTASVGQPGQVPTSTQAPIGNGIPTATGPIPAVGGASMTTFGPTTYVIETHPVPTPPVVAWIEARQASNTHPVITKAPQAPAAWTEAHPEFQV